MLFVMKIHRYREEAKVMMNKKYIPISVIIPTYNSIHFIKETVDSLLNQTVELREIIVIDDNSNDGTQILLNELKQINNKKLILKFLTENVGSSEARNIGLRIANTQWVLFMDHDDIAEPDLVESEWTKLQKLETQNRGTWVLVHSAYQQITENGEKLPGIHSWRQVEPDEILGYELIRNQILSCSGILLNKEVALKVGGFDSSLVYSQDWDLWLRMAQIGGFGYIDKPLIKIRRHSTNTSRKVSTFLEDELRILKKYDLDFIEGAVNRRHLPWEINRADYVAMLYRMGYWEKGYSMLQDILQQKRDYPNFFFLIALYHLQKSHWESACIALERTLRLNPDHGAALNNLGALKVMEGKLKQAGALLRKALLLFPGYLDAQHNLQKLSDPRITSSELKFTWRELRPVLVSYKE